MSLILHELGQNSFLIKNYSTLDVPQQVNEDTSHILLSRKAEFGFLSPLLV